MLRIAGITAVMLVLGCASTTVATARTPPPRVAPALTVASRAPALAAFRNRLGFSSRTRYGYGYSRRSPSLLHRAVKTAIWLYVLHLFFSHGGISILLWIIIISVGLSLLRRRHRRHASRARSFWP
jgi:hypothetical protein